MKCYKCKKILKKTDTFCPKCGSKIKGRSKYFLRMLLVLFLLVALVCTGVFAYEDQQKKKVTNAVIEFLDAYQRADGQVCGKLLYNNDLDAAIEFSETEILLAKGVCWKLDKCQWEKNMVRVTVEIENMDFSQVFENLLKQQDEVTEDALNNQISQVQLGGQYRKVFVCDVFVYNVDEEWKVSMTEELSNALHGGMNEYVNSLIDSEVE